MLRAIAFVLCALAGGTIVALGALELAAHAGSW